VKVAGVERFFGEVLVPTEDVREFNKAGKQRITKRKLYPGYIVVNMEINDDSWFLVRETSGIGDFTGAAGKPAPLTPEEVSRIIATTKPEVEEDGEDNIKTAIPFKWMIVFVLRKAIFRITRVRFLRLMSGMAASR
jgi:transcriptional antiterminator NusG